VESGSRLNQVQKLYLVHHKRLLEPYLNHSMIMLEHIWTNGWLKYESDGIPFDSV